MTAMSPMQVIKNAQAFGKYTGALVDSVMVDYVPRHNAMQAKFLDDDFRLKMVALSYFGFLLDERWYVKKPLQSKVDFESSGWDVSITVPPETIWRESEELVLPSECMAASIFVDLVPDVGDDYPFLLRLLKEQSDMVGIDNKSTCAVLVYEKFIARGISEAEFVAIFNACGFVVLKLSDIENASSINIMQRVVQNVGYVTGEKGRTENNLYLLDIPCRRHGMVHLKATMGHRPLSVEFNDAMCKDHCRLCQELSSYCLLCFDDCGKE